VRGPILFEPRKFSAQGSPDCFRQRDVTLLFVSPCLAMVCLGVEACDCKVLELICEADFMQIMRVL
jgi:hypothetical protein